MLSSPVSLVSVSSGVVVLVKVVRRSQIYRPHPSRRYLSGVVVLVKVVRRSQICCPHLSCWCLSGVVQ